MNIGIEGSWVEMLSCIPFRRRYFYWDKTEGALAKECFKSQGINVKYMRFMATSSEYPLIAGYFFSCWSWDRYKVQWILNSIYLTLKAEGLYYDNFLNLWHQNLLTLEKEDTRMNTDGKN